MGDILASVSTRKTPQNKAARADQVKNNAGGYVFQIGDDERLHRFLTLGSDGNTYYQRAKDITEANAAVVFRMASENDSHQRLVDAILNVSENGRAPKNKQAIFALAIAAATDNPERNKRALAIVHKVCRTFTHLAQFNTYVENFRGRGPALNTAIGNWYKLKNISGLANQATKYRSREDWSHRDLLRLVKSKAGTTGEIGADRDALYGWIARGVTPEQGLLPIVDDFMELQSLDSGAIGKVVDIIERGHGVTWEMIPDHFRKTPKIWESLIGAGMPATALMRQLPTITNVMGGPGAWVSVVAPQLGDPERLKNGRVHPVNVLVAQRTYASGRSVRGSNTWHPVSAITDALDAGFYASYGAVEPTGKRILVGLDVSASMRSSMLVDYDDKGRQYRMPINAAEIASALGLVLTATEAPGAVEAVVFTSAGYQGAQQRLIGYRQGYGRLAVPVYQSVGGWGHNNGVQPFDLSARRRLDDVLAATRGLPHGGTDCALPFTWAMENNRDFDAVVIITDNETWAGPIHVHQAAKAYREKVGHDVKLIAAAMTATEYSVADPKNASEMNVSGFDSAVPQLMGDFIAGRV